MSLKEYSTNQLLEEVVRRINAAGSKDVTQWCEDCNHFVPNPTATDDYNPCDMAHKMDFRVPAGYDDEYGFYRLICSDRQEQSNDN